MTSDLNLPKNCTTDENADCANCTIHGQLNCKFEKKYLAGFLTYVIPFFFSSLFGIIYAGILTGIWFFLIIYVCFLVLFFTVIEIRILCRHCPYYAKEGKTIHCHANEGLPRLWQYAPKPLTRLEKISFLVCLLFFGIFPIFTEIYGIWIIFINYTVYGLFTLLGLIGITIATLIAILAWFSGLRLFFCPNCVNFSCPLNRVSKSVIDAYLEKNPIIKEAWEKSGYKMG
jgi:hypothetical protein